ncbi:hypothetical protein TSUD_170100 [Trifolium subterraneum]|uniref:Xylanase inhibitor N-terminal domain-containing protein n=1 Tax=Trifolium subterraneum TaxID=3900 RepID=A0A2Z6PBQ4_TRISU|nr:hypothetical protein TSUD_170100 [Trifolium subterraneum]
MKGTLISLVLTALLVTSLFQPHQHILAASQNNTDEVTNGCIGLQCQFAISNEADLFMDQLTVGPSRMLLSGPSKSIIFAAGNRNKQAVDCDPNTMYNADSCLGAGDHVCKLANALAFTFC